MTPGRQYTIPTRLSLKRKSVNEAFSDKTTSPVALESMFICVRATLAYQ